MDKEKILTWITKTESYRIRDYENKNGMQRLALVSLEKPDEFCNRTYRSDYPDFSHCLTKNPWWKRFLFREKYAGIYKKTITIDPRRLVVREAVDDKVFWQADTEKNQVLAQIIAGNVKRLAVFRQELKAYFADLALHTENNMFPFQCFFYEELCQKHPEKTVGLEYIRLLFCKCNQEKRKQTGLPAKLMNPLEYLDEALYRGFPYNSIIFGYVQSVYANFYKSFYGDVEFLCDIFDCSESLVLHMDGHVDDCRMYLRFPKMLDLLVEYLEC